MPSLVFLQPWFLFALGAASLPVIIHLIHRRKRRRVPFSAMRFLLQTDRRSARKYHLVDLLVLLLRVLLLLLLALALSQPVVRPSGAKGVEFGKLSLALVIDDSMSMQRSVNGIRLFDRALEAARELVGGIPEDGEAFVLFSSGRTPRSLSAPASPPTSLADSISNKTPSFSSRPLAKTIAEAIDTLSGSKNRHRALVVIGDSQKRSWEGVEALDSDKLEKQIRSVHLIDIQGQASNLALEDVSGSPLVCFPGTPIRFRARVSSSFSEPVESAASLWLDGQKVQGEPVSLSPGAVGEAVMTRVLNEPGTHRATLRLEPDGLAGDNERHLVLRVIPFVRALLIVPDGAKAGGRDEAVFLDTALNPLRTPNFSGAAPVEVKRVAFGRFREELLVGQDFVFVLDDGLPFEAFWEALSAYVRRGGRALSFPALQWLRDLDGGDSLEGRSYARLGLRGAWRVSGQGVPAGFGEMEREHPVFALLNRSAPELFDAVAVRAYLDVDESRLAASERVLARLDSGAPLLVESSLGRGLFLSWTTGCHPDWGDLPLRPLFLPLLYESLKHAEVSGRGRVRSASIDKGLAVEFVPSAHERSVRVTLPSGKEEYAALGAGRGLLEFLETPDPGFYEIEILEESSRPLTVALNVDRAESDLERVDLELLASHFPESIPFQVEKDAAKVARRLSYSSQGYALSGSLLALALLVFLCEIYLSNALLRVEKDRPEWLRRFLEKRQA